jgi:hypothetical protein
MTKYEYDFEDLKLTEEQRQLFEVGLVKPEDVNSMVKEIINARVADGWEPMYPFGIPLWFRKPKPARRKKVTKKS